MMSKNFIVPSLFLVVVATASFSCMPAKKFVAQNSKYDISKVPQGYDPQKHILLVAESPRLGNKSKTNYAVTRKVNRKLKKYFPYKYQIASPQEIMASEGKYSDTSLYRYALMNSEAVFGQGTVMNPTHATTIIDFGFYDRVSEERYPMTGNGFPQLKYTVLALGSLIKKAKGDGNPVAYKN